jgi:hypothetical protein
MIDRAMAVAGFGLAIISLVFGIVFPKISKGWAWGGFILGILLLVGAGGLLLVPVDAQTPPAVNGNCNTFGNNNFNCNTLNVVPERLGLTETLKADLLAKVPKNKPGQVNIYGPSQADLRVGMQILDFLKMNGYNASLGETAMYAAPMPDKPLTLLNSPTSSSWTLTVAPSVR